MVGMEPVAATARDGYVDLRGVTFHYRDWGGQGRDLLLLHGLASNARFWDLAAPNLVEDFRVLALDLRGHGASGKPEDGYDFPGVAADVAAFVQAMGLRNPILVGHSWGGNVVIQVGADYPDVPAGLVCIDGGTFEPSSLPGATWAKIKTALAPPDFTAMGLTWEGLLEGSRTRGMADLWGDHLEDFLHANFEIQPDGAVLPRLNRETHMVIVRALWEQRPSLLFPQIACPVLLMPARMGAESSGTKWDQKGNVTRALSLLSQGRLVWMEDSIHDVPVQRPAEVSQVILDANREGFFG